jgi:hypothetical protein
MWITEACDQKRRIAAGLEAGRFCKTWGYFASAFKRAFKRDL